MSEHENEPLGLPAGSVRSILVISLVAVVELIALGVTIRALVAANDDFVREAFLMAFAAMVSLANLGVGYYFGQRNHTSPAE
jgi:hypothetical protein